ncbi:hypothetical protein ALC60_08067, partial [Trachymyrmex zeteki]
VTTRVPVERGSSEVIRRIFTHRRRNVSSRRSPGRRNNQGGARRTFWRSWVSLKLARRGTSAGMVRACLRGFPWILAGIRQRNDTHVVLRDPTSHTTHFPTTHTANDTTKRDCPSAMASASAAPIGRSATNQRTANDGRGRQSAAPRSLARCCARDFLFYVSAPKIRATNPQCSLKTEVVCDRSKPTVTFSLQSGKKIVLKTALLTSLNILQLYNKHITSLIPPDPAELEAKKALQEEKRKKQKRPHHRIKLWSKHRGQLHLI